MSIKGKAFGHAAKWRKEQATREAARRNRQAQEFAALPQTERMRILLGIPKGSR